MVGLSGAGSAIGLVIGGSSVLGMMKKKPEAFVVVLCFPGCLLHRGCMVLLHLSCITGLLPSNYTVPGMCCSWSWPCSCTCLFYLCNLSGKVCANGIAAIGQGHNVFGNTMVLAAFPEFYAILSLVAAILMQGLMRI
jgi:V/A-type H+-transporting ATPase subunit K